MSSLLDAQNLRHADIHFQGPHKSRRAFSSTRDVICSKSALFRLQSSPQRQQIYANESNFASYPSSKVQRTLTGSALIAVSSLLVCGEALAAVHGEPANALSIPTWIIHISSVIEWTSAMLLMWRFAEVTGNPRWKGMTWGMIPLFMGALTACTYHFFYNAPEVEFLVPIQAALTWIGNATLWIAAYRIYEGSETAKQDKEAERT